VTSVSAAIAARNVAYEERAIVVVAIANIAMSQGLKVWFALDEKEPEWPVLFIDLPTGQCSWHFTREQRRDLASNIPNGPNTWDGHTTQEKYDRLMVWAASRVVRSGRL
jgi:hypothetical protein